jgi:hypothetical protein
MEPNYSDDPTVPYDFEFSFNNGKPSMYFNNKKTALKVLNRQYPELAVSKYNRRVDIYVAKFYHGDEVYWKEIGMLKRR